MPKNQDLFYQASWTGVRVVGSRVGGLITVHVKNRSVSSRVQPGPLLTPLGLLST